MQQQKLAVTRRGALDTLVQLMVEKKKPDFPRFGAAVTAAMKRAGHTDEEVSGMIGVTREMVRRYRGGITLPRPKPMKKLAELLGINEAALYGTAASTPTLKPDSTIPMMGVTADEQRLVDAYRQMPGPARKALQARAVESLEGFGKATPHNPFGKGTQ